MFWVFSDRLEGSFCSHLVPERVLLDARNGQKISTNDGMGNGAYVLDSYVLEKADDQKFELNKGVSPHLIQIFDHRPSQVRT